jgi:hypothetical protein
VSAYSCVSGPNIPARVLSIACRCASTLGSVVDAIEATGSSSNSAMRFSSRGIASRICVSERLADRCCVGGADLLLGMALGRRELYGHYRRGYLFDPIASTNWRYTHGERSTWAPLAGLIGDRSERQDAEEGQDGECPPSPRYPRLIREHVIGGNIGHDSLPGCGVA